MKMTNLRVVLCMALVLAMSVQATSQKQGPPGPKIKVGDTAPEFTLKDQTGKEVSLRDFRGKKNVVLAFYVFAFTGG